MDRIRLLILSNETYPGQQEGRFNGFQLLAESGEIDAASREFMVAQRGETLENAENRVLDRLRSSDYTHVLLWNSGDFPSSSSRQDAMFAAIGRRPIIFWEGDPWGPGKTRPEAVHRWIRQSTAVFSVAGSPQVDDLLSIGAQTVHQTLHTYSHLDFSESEEPPPLPARPSVSMISSQLMRLVPGTTMPLHRISGLPGSSERWTVGKQLHRRFGSDFYLYGPGWPASWSKGPLPFNRQVAAIRDTWALANWDHYAYLSDYASDRLPIALVSGRPQVTTRHPGMGWFPGGALGVYEEDAPSDVVARILSIVDEGPGGASQVNALEGRRWVLHRLSDREGARHVVSSLDERVAPPPADPWSLLPGPFSKSSAVSGKTSHS